MKVLNAYLFHFYRLYDHSNVLINVIAEVLALKAPVDGFLSFSGKNSPINIREYKEQIKNTRPTLNPSEEPTSKLFDLNTGYFQRQTVSIFMPKARMSTGHIASLEKRSNIVIGVCLKRSL
jgi:hypothetical protein